MNHRILLIDFDAKALAAWGDLLDSRGYDVTRAGKGAKIDKIIDEINPALVILEPMMPGQDGFQLCRSLKANNPKPPAVIIASRIFKGGRYRNLAKDVGANVFLEKPIPDSRLMAEVAKFVQPQAETAAAPEAIPEQAAPQPTPAPTAAATPTPAIPPAATRAPNPARVSSASVTLGPPAPPPAHVGPSPVPTPPSPAPVAAPPSIPLAKPAPEPVVPVPPAAPTSAPAPQAQPLHAQMPDTAIPAAQIPLADMPAPDAPADAAPATPAPPQAAPAAAAPIPPAAQPAAPAAESGADTGGSSVRVATSALKTGRHAVINTPPIIPNGDAPLGDISDDDIEGALSRLVDAKDGLFGDADPAAAAAPAAPPARPTGELDRALDRLDLGMDQAGPQAPQQPAIPLDPQSGPAPAPPQNALPPIALDASTTSDDAPAPAPAPVPVNVQPVPVPPQQPAPPAPQPQGMAIDSDLDRTFGSLDGSTPAAAAPIAQPAPARPAGTDTADLLASLEELEGSLPVADATPSMDDLSEPAVPPPTPEEEASLEHILDDVAADAAGPEPEHTEPISPNAESVRVSAPPTEGSIQDPVGEALSLGMPAASGPSSTLDPFDEFESTSEPGEPHEPSGSRSQMWLLGSVIAVIGAGALTGALMFKLGETGETVQFAQAPSSSSRPSPADAGWQQEPEMVITVPGTDAKKKLLIQS